MQESCDADLLLHVIDAGGEELEEKVEQVEEMLREIGAEDVPQIEIYNKIDLKIGVKPRIERNSDGVIRRIYLSASTGTGMDLLRQASHEWASVRRRCYRLHLGATTAKLRARLYDLDAVVAERIEESGGWEMGISIEPWRLESLRKRPEYKTCYHMSRFGSP